ncbi:hypothetical protein SKAU_G00002830 [Synaphobranchus kaupii]|uniref:Uncharacterized protein n=1 Tax=Synaphobranchus kaupii TaxID=118154 RepID=A0A9Q1G8K1_SYNKA|nr:hypothetical protein SKAU_G00002830 [Synaphobranchus kaupii]
MSTDLLFIPIKVHKSSTKPSAESFPELPLEFNVLILSGSVVTESEDCIPCVLSLSKVWLQCRQWACPG